ncbi:MAG: SDR family NAD(P)-dependent oxidoreductase [Saprospiraceae bacterium]|nr:SDR family NAD(P)-dependent oxidoreductase [Saprospiraceae bacterium]
MERSKKRVFLTGAASGLGLELGLILASQGWSLGITDIRQDVLAEAARKFESAGAANVMTYSFDVSDRPAYEEAAVAFLEWAGGIDLLINNAGVGDGGDFSDYKLDDWEWLMQVNFLGVVYGCKLFIDTFQKQKSGLIINISSAAAFANGPGMSAYNASKAAVRSLSETLSYELLPYNIGVCVVMPTFFKTDVMQYARGPAAAQHFAKKMIDRSELEASTVAKEILEKALAGKAEIILPTSARKLYRIKRYFPALFRRKAKEAVWKNFQKRS